MKKKSFSLLEIIVAITLVAVITTYAGINIVGLFHDRRFNESCKYLSSQVQMCQKFAVLSQGGVILRITKENDEYILTIDGETLSSQVTKKLLKQQKKLKGIAEMCCTPDSQYISDTFTLTFYPDRSCYLDQNKLSPSTQLEISPTYQKLQPRTIDLTYDDEWLSHVQREANNVYPQEVRSDFEKKTKESVPSR